MKYACDTCLHNEICEHQPEVQCDLLFELIRCKDCERFGNEGNLKVCYARQELTEEEGFCDWAERKKNDHT